MGRFRGELNIRKFIKIKEVSFQKIVKANEWINKIKIN